jgi:translation initiation factor 2 subunit 2
MADRTALFYRQTTQPTYYFYLLHTATMSDKEDNSGEQVVEKVDSDNEKEQNEDGGDIAFDPSKKKKRRKPKAKPKQEEEEPAEGEGEGDDGDDDKDEEMVEEGPGAWLGTDRDYTYSELLTRLYDTIAGEKGQGEGLGMGSNRKPIEPPKVGRIGTKRIAWINFMNNCKSVNRKPDHVLAFVLAELGTTGSIGGDNKLIIKGRFQSKQLENVLRKYIAEYVICRTCRSPETELKKENRLLFKVCKACGSSHTVQSIKTGFRANTQRVRK